MGVIKVTDSDGNVGYLETSIDLTTTTPSSPARLVQNRELLANGAGVATISNPIPITITNWTSNAPVNGPANAVANTVPKFSDTTGKNLTNSGVIIGSDGLFADLLFSGTIAPKTPTALTPSTQQNDVATNGVLVLSLAPTANISVTGFIAGTVQASTSPDLLALDGRLLIVRNINASVFTVTLGNSSSSSLAANRIQVPGNSLVLSTGAQALLVYDGTIGNWRVLAATYSAADTVYSRNQTFARALALTIGTATTLTGTTVDYTLSNGPYWQLSGLAAATIYNMGNVVAGSFRVIENVGTFPITLSHEAGPTNGTAVNNFNFPDAQDYVLLPKHRIPFLYDTTNSRWRPIGITRGSIGNYPVASLPTSTAMGSAKGPMAIATNGRKTAEGSGAGTGCPVWWDGTNWKTFYDNSTVVA